MKRRAAVAAVGVGALLLLLLLAMLLPRVLAGPRMLARGATYQVHALSGPVRAHVLTLDLKNTDARVHVRAAGASLSNLAPLAEIVAVGSASDEVLAAVNGGQFEKDGTPIGLLVCRGAMLRGSLARPAITFNEESSPFISRFDADLLYASRQFPTGVPVDRYNRPGAGEVCVYSDAYTHDILAPTGSVFLSVQGMLLHGLYPAKITYGRVERIDFISSATAMTTSPHKLLVRFTGPQAELWGKLHFINQMVTFTPKITGTLWVGEITDAVGGSDVLLSGGQIPAELRNEERVGRDSERDARTAVGYSEDHRKLFLVVVEGGHAGSVGMTLSELARFLVGEKVSDAINLDGGGSSGVWLAGEGMVSRPDGARPINNALLVVRRPQPKPTP